MSGTQPRIPGTERQPSQASSVWSYRLNLYSAKINTLGDHAKAVFLISGAALSDAKAVLKLKQELLNRAADLTAKLLAWPETSL